MKTNLWKASAAPSLVALWMLSSLTAASAQEPKPTVSGVTGVKQDALERSKTIVPVTPPPPDQGIAQAVTKVNGVQTIDGVKAAGRLALPQAVPPPPAASVTSAAGGSIGTSGSIRAINGVSGIDTAKLRNLEAAIVIKEGGATPSGSGAERGGKGKAAAAALLSAPLEKAAPKIGPKEDGRAGFQEFEKLQNRGS